MHTSLVFTVAQSKRLIAKAVVQLPEVKQALAKGTVAVPFGTTNAYVAEELLGHSIPKGEYVAGRTLPPGMPGAWLGSGKHPELILKQGQRVEGIRAVEALPDMGPGDVFIKGANALDYTRKVAGLLIGHPTGGTIGASLGAVISRKIHLIIPVGLEKLVYGDVLSLSVASRRPDYHPDAPTVSLFPFTGTIVTEIEALRVLCGVEAQLYSAGGVAGAEGAVWLLIDGDRQALDKALELHDSLKGEPNLMAEARPE